MAAGKNFELLDNYLLNRLSQGEREEFEATMEADPELKQEFQFQQSLVESVRSKRMAELKTMLNNIPVPFSQSSQAELLTKVAASVVVVGLATTAIYFYLSGEEAGQVQETPTEQVTPLIEQVTPLIEQVTPLIEPEPNQNSTGLSEGANQKNKVSSSPSKPVVAEPGTTSSVKPKERTEATRQRERELVKVISSTFVTSSTEVITQSEFGNYNFHYAFENQKLVLYGSFEKNQYQILEFITKDEHVFFLNYKSNYYLLDDRLNSPAPLLLIQDPLLLKKLKEFRTK